MTDYQNSIYRLVKNIRSESGLKRIYKLALFLYLKEEG